MTIEQLNPLYTFQTFVIGSHNQFAHAAALAVAEAPGRTYNPFYIYGGDSETRTHLLHAIGHEIVKRHRQARLLYISAHQFIKELKDARSRDARSRSRSSKFPELGRGFGTRAIQTREDYCNYHVLLVDNIQDLINQEEAQEELLYIFDSLHNSQRQMVFSSDCRPRELNAVERLQSRFEWGMVADMEPMDRETIVAALRGMAKIQKIKLTDDIAFLIADKLKSLTNYSDSTRMRSLGLILETLDKFRAKASSSLNKYDLINEVILKVEKEISPGSVKRVQIISATAQVLEMLRRDYANIHQLSPESFEIFICDRLDKMGLNVARVGSTYKPDGGVDIVAWPRKPAPFPFLLAAQVKHHMRPFKKTGPDAVKDLQAVIASKPFHAGLLVTSTSFTPSAHWFAANHPHIIRLRDMKDLQRWIWNNFTDDEEWREIPSSIELAPGVNIKIDS